MDSTVDDINDSIDAANAILNDIKSELVFLG